MAKGLCLFLGTRNTAVKNPALDSADLMIMVVNATFHLTGLKAPAKADVTPVDTFQPTEYSAINSQDFYKTLNLKPDDYALGKSPATGLPGEAPKEQSNNDLERHAPHDEPATATTARSQAIAPPSLGERIVSRRES